MFFAPEEILFPAELDSALKPRSRVVGLDKLWEKLAKGRGQIAEGEKHYSFSRSEAEAYAAYYLPANALKTALVMEEAFLSGCDAFGREADWLDCGTGPGTAYWGLAWWAAKRGKKLKFAGWDQSSVFADIARSMTSRSPFGARAEFLAGGKEDAIALVRKRAPTHVSFVNSIAEIYPDPARRLEAVRALVRALSDCTKRDGKARYLLIVEPGSRDSSRELATLKDALGWPVLLPCQDDRKCGALVRPTDWCHEEVACRFPDWLNEIGAEAKMRKESLLFSYALIPVSGAALTGGSRLVSQRMERKGQVECWVCTRDGKKMARVQRSKAGEGSEILAEGSRGNMFSALELDEKGDFMSGALRDAPGGETVFEQA